MAVDSVNERLQTGLFIDIESTFKGEIREVGFSFGDVDVVATTARDRSAAFRRLDELANDATFVAGHNILWHDLPLIADNKLCPRLLKRPVLDTLLLSPLAFPQKPYHRLVKNDKLVTTSKSNPLNDAHASRRIALDALHTFTGSASEHWPVYAALLKAGNLPQCATNGIDWIGNVIGAEVLDRDTALARFIQSFGDRFCASGLQRLLASPDDPERWISLAYVAAWIRVAGTDSIIPPWVKRHFNSVNTVLRALRSVPCGDPSCGYCAEMHDPVRQLSRIFNYPAFRPEPALPDAPEKSLQEEIVRRAFADQSLLGILPTGGGKSLCFQLPGLQRYYRDGSLTVVISPLQALMKDQVDGLAAKTGVRCIGALHGLLTPPERGELLDELQMGGIGIVYVSPEQLRNPSFRAAIALRDIAYWVCDEAHCISKWGHDFRPDYLHISRFIRELAEENSSGSIAPILCLTATAKEEVKLEIQEHFRDRLGKDLQVLDGGAERDNLAYRVEPVDHTGKSARVHAILKDRLADASGAAVVFVATRDNAEQMAEVLKALRWKAEYFHAGLDPEEKKDILERFLAGEIRVICATNAFGMGIDKEDIRLVIHADVPGSLENYLQEAGRAGRDREPAECILLFDPSDLEKQFSLSAFSRIHDSDVRKILTALRYAERRGGKDDQVSLSTREILLGCDGGTSMEDDPDGVIDTKVKTAIALLEEGGFLARNDNITRVFQGRPLVENMEQADVLIRRASLPPATAELWRQFMHVFFTMPENAHNAVERFAEVGAMKRIYEIEQEKHGRFWNRYRPIFDALNDMADARLIRKDLLISAIVHVDTAGASDKKRQWWIRLERRMLDHLRELDPSPEGKVPLNFRKLNTILSREFERLTLAEQIPVIFELWKKDRPRMDGGASAFVYRRHGPGYIVELPDGWDPIVKAAELRQHAGSQILDHILAMARETHGKGRIEVEFSESDLIETLRGDLLFSSSNSRSLARIIRFVLVSLHEQDVIVLRNGKALFTQSMQIQLQKDPDGRYSRRFSKAHYARLEIHYQERNFQIHVMAEYARRAIDSLTAHLCLIRDYFQLDNEAFAQRYFAGRRQERDLATGIESYRRIVEQLGNKRQQEIVSAPETRNMLVLAGPGSGKTRVVAHRCAYLLRVRRVRPRAILVVCFNRHACLTLRRRIHQLVGDEARGVTIQTYHGLALSIMGKTIADDGPRGSPESLDFDSLITDATKVLAETPDDAIEEESGPRNRLLRGFRHILVDEYQDIATKEYEFLSCIAGRTRQEADQKLSILAVGDDDQSIYGFRAASTEFIRRFESDYSAESHHLVQNYRSTANIISTANQLIQQNRDRMKTGYDITVDDRRRMDPPGGRFQDIDRFRKGRVQVISVTCPAHEPLAILEEIRNIRQLDEHAHWRHFAVISRNRADLNLMRALLESEGIPLDWRADTDGLASPFRIREIHTWLDKLYHLEEPFWDIATLDHQLRAHNAAHSDSTWCGLLTTISEEWKAEIGGSRIDIGDEERDEAPDAGRFSVRLMRDFFIEALREHRQEARRASGVTLANAHRVKGLEFPHVFVLSDNWQTAGARADVEEERRLYYVAMTRAEQTLTLYQNAALSRWLDPIQGAAVLRRRWEPEPAALQSMRGVSNLRYTTLSLDQVFINFAGMRTSGSRIHRSLRRLKTGDSLRMTRVANHITLRAPDGIDVARLSRKGTSAWIDRLDSIENVVIQAILTRHREDGDPSDTIPVRSDTWEIPIVEVAWREQEEPVLKVAEDQARYGGE